MKKIVFAVAIALAASTLSVSTASAYTTKANDLIKVSGKPAVYIVGADMKRHLFTTEDTFWSWYTGTWKTRKVNVIPQADFDRIETGKNVTIRPGTKLIKFGSSNVVFVTIPGRVLCYAEAGAFGDTYNKRFTKVPVSYEGDYDPSRTCTIRGDMSLPAGSLIQYAGSKDVYLIDGFNKRKVTAAGMSANNFKTEFVVRNVPTGMTYATGADITGFEPTLSIHESVR